jgi:hypothetical protein
MSVHEIRVGQPFKFIHHLVEMKQTSNTFRYALEKTKLNELQKLIFQLRFIEVLKTFESRAVCFAWFFHILRILISVGSLIVPALLSIQYSDTSTNTNLQDPTSFAYEIYWATWVISLLVTTSNGIVSVFKIDKKYYFIHTTMEQLRSEGWQYLELSGRYSGFHTPGIVPTHENQFIYFCHAIEKIKMHQVEEEYFKLTDSHTHTSGSSTHKTDGKQEKENTLVHPTPQASLEEIAKNLPPELLRQLKSIAFVDGGPSQPETDAKKTNTATAPPLPVSTDMSTASVAEKGLLRSPSNTEMPTYITV